ncbi:MAG: hypothetical protein EWV85_25050 [Microcystis aeruginosa Ma_QC_C_20070703_M131]|uniref:Uncharacterized protein n=1 Tax=Microcystis aeruginosa Ma_QC_C_20070703_M131 TaxID=2486263 RepID=A0A551X0R3_MICAE|nr:MAG: hypothetical protein EWV85_25050 [Microcystis aeruginosa Ma_QC_C_20070703_M131]
MIRSQESGDRRQETGDRRQEIIFIYSPHTLHPTPHTPHPTPLRIRHRSIGLCNCQYRFTNFFVETGS